MRKYKRSLGGLDERLRPEKAVTFCLSNSKSMNRRLTSYSAKAKESIGTLTM